jgi:hypothetical protein
MGILLLFLQRIVHALELAGNVMEEFANASGPRMDAVDNQCREFMGSIKVHLSLEFLTLTVPASLFDEKITLKKYLCTNPISSQK